MWQTLLSYCCVRCARLFSDQLEAPKLLEVQKIIQDPLRTLFSYRSYITLDSVLLWSFSSVLFLHNLHTLIYTTNANDWQTGIAALQNPQFTI